MNSTKSFLKNAKRKRNKRLQKAIKTAQYKRLNQESLIVYVDDKGHLTSIPPAVVE